MRRFPILLCLLALAGCRPGAVRIDTPQGKLYLEPMAEDAIRVRMTPEGAPRLGELVFTEKVKAPEYSVERRRRHRPHGPDGRRMARRVENAPLSRC